MALWDRQAGESYPAFEAFQKFLTDRSYPQVAEALSKSKALIKRWAKAHDWRARADAWDAEVSRQAMAKASEDFAAMIERQINIGRMFQARGANAIQQMNLNNLPPRFLSHLVDLVKVGVQVERSARDLKTSQPQENLFVETLTRIWEEDEP